MNRTIFKIVLVITFVTTMFAMNCHAVTLGFIGPNRTINPGETFDVSVVAFVDEYEMDGWSEDISDVRKFRASLGSKRWYWDEKTREDGGAKGYWLWRLNACLS